MRNNNELILEQLIPVLCKHCFKDYKEIQSSIDYDPVDEIVVQMQTMLHDWQGRQGLPYMCADDQLNDDEVRKDLNDSQIQWLETYRVMWKSLWEIANG